jgi:hypothetical protein
MDTVALNKTQQGVLSRVIHKGRSAQMTIFSLDNQLQLAVRLSDLCADRSLPPYPEDSWYPFLLEA